MDKLRFCILLASSALLSCVSTERNNVSSQFENMTQQELAEFVLLGPASGRKNFPDTLDALEKIREPDLLRLVSYQDSPNRYPNTKKYARLMLDLYEQGTFDIDFTVTQKITDYEGKDFPTPGTCRDENISIEITRESFDGFQESTNVSCPTSFTSQSAFPKKRITFELDWDSIYERLGLSTANLTAGDGYTPLLRAIEEESEIEVIALLSEGADPNIPVNLTQSGPAVRKTFYGKTSLVLAVEKENVEIVRSLIGNGAEPELNSKYDATPLYLAVKLGQEEIVEILLDAGADPNSGGYQFGGFDHSPLYAATKNMNDAKPRIIDLLLEAGADPNHAPKNSITPLQSAANWGDVRVLNSLISHGADVKAQNSNGYSALHSAVLGFKHDGVDVVRILLESGADLEAKTYDGSTALHYAAREGDADAIMLLLDRGADANSRDRDDKTPLGVAQAQRRPNQRAIGLLREASDAI